MGFKFIIGEIVATASILILYIAACFAVKNRWNDKITLNPLKIIADPSGKASLSSAQVMFFTLIVLWLAVYWVVQEGELVSIDKSVLVLLGITIVGSGVGKVTDATRFRVTAENWAWVKNKTWIKRDFTRASMERTPRISDLLTTDQGFDIARFQAVAFSIVVGIALLWIGYTAESAESFSNLIIDEAYLALVGISQGAYVGGKYVGGNLFQELNTKLDEVRTLEVNFAAAVTNSTKWKEVSKHNRNITLASQECAPSEYISYMSAAKEASEIIGSMTGNSIDSARIEPALPS